MIMDRALLKLCMAFRFEVFGRRPLPLAFFEAFLHMNNVMSSLFFSLFFIAHAS